MLMDLEIAMCLPALVTCKEGTWLAGLCFMTSVCTSSVAGSLCDQLCQCPLCLCVSGTRAALLPVEAAVRKAATMSLRDPQALGWAPAVGQEGPGLEQLGKVAANLTSLSRIIFSDTASSLVKSF